MSGKLFAMNEVQRRAKARCIRALIQMESPQTSMTEACDKHKISRTTGYRILEELIAWEQTATPQTEAAEIMAQTRQTTYHPNLWLLVSGKTLMAYMQGQDGFGPELFTGTPDAAESLAVDPLCE